MPIYVAKKGSTAEGKSIFAEFGLKDPAPAIPAYLGIPQKKDEVPPLFIPEGSVLVGEVTEDGLFVEVETIDGMPATATSLNIFVEVSMVQQAAGV